MGRAGNCWVLMLSALAFAQGSGSNGAPKASSAPHEATAYIAPDSQPAMNGTGISPGTDPENRLIAPFLKHMASDQKQFWTGPMNLGKPAAWKTFGPFLGFTGLLTASDSWISRQVPDGPSQLKRSQNISTFGTYTLAGVAGSAYLWGALTRNDHMRETGLLAGEAAANSTVAAFLLKNVTQRPRPLEGNGDGRFFQGGSSFPSEHSALAWSIASVVAHEYPGTLTKIAAYSLASAVTLTRVTGKEHFPSDVVVGSALGWYLGRQIYRAHHDPELGGAWGNFYGPSDDFDRPPIAEHMGSTYMPLDSWVYPALDRLAALGFIRGAFVGLKPWTRMECARLIEEASSGSAEDGGDNRDIAAMFVRLREEFVDEFRLLDGGRNSGVHLDSVYSRVVSISGPALTDSLHFGQTLSYDFGRPFGRGTSTQVGGAFRFAQGPLAIYLRAEFQHAPSIPAPSDAVRTLIAERDQVPEPPAVPRDTINRARLLDAYVALKVGKWQISAGRQSLSWAPGPGGSLLWSDNAEPIDMVRITNPEPFRLPSVLGLLGPVRVDHFVGRLEGHGYIPHPFVYGQKINFKPIPSLEIGFGRTITIGGKGGDPFTWGNFVDSYFGRVVTPPGQGPSVPGDNHVSMDWTFYVPKVRNYLVFYGEVYADDDLIPWQNPAKNPYRPGLYVTRIPGIPKLDFHVEAASTESPGFHSGNRGNLNYWNSKYRDGYVNNGNLLGNTVGRDGRSIQYWFTYWFSPRNTLQFAYKHNSVSADFVPQGGAWQDYGLAHQVQFRSGLYIKSNLQYEHISRYPLLFDGREHNTAAVVEFGFTPAR